MTVRVDHVVTSGTFSLDGGTWDVDNNVWLVGDDTEVVIIDAAHDPDAILAAADGRRVVAVICTHGHDDHINAAADLAAPVYLHPADDFLWRAVHPTTDFHPLHDGQHFEVGGVFLEVLHTPGHAPGCVSIHAPQLNAVFTGDTLFEGGPGATGRSFSDFPTIIKSITERLLVLPANTKVHTGHGSTTTIGAEAPHLEEWIARGH
ncbi:MBL fold metallo-hydrolase [Actinokineospora cianjurensis]|uniref:Glyoxylase-like metal-dependent hydrolase (Beta-lactamase superfamily II) n=1 Tax=Actinokineospora cianjurensis TaxID=585224 RepID=A0A421B6T0_9PSEU|nr:MBL fold metallo-hydrolase [Actinokineospora cianjurensis]RLK60161.1 glyoxylase-like metal-dependent hydrolase (beta-lactamase superfamily II) [Actinokineospora cianjurensis]